MRTILIGLLISSWLTATSCSVDSKPLDNVAVLNSEAGQGNEGNTSPESRNTPRVRGMDFTGAPAILWLNTSSTYTIFRSMDAGQTWSEPDLIPNEISGAYQIHFFSPDIGWIVDTKAAVWKTTDGGRTWSKKTSFRTDVNDPNFISATQILFISLNEGWIFETFGAFYTSDGGDSWKKVKPFQIDARKVVSIGGSKMWAIGDKSNEGSAWIGRSTDRGKSWSVVKIADDCNSGDLFFVTSDIGWASCSGRQLLKSTDGGKDWSRQLTLPTNFQILSIFWANSDRGWLAGYSCQETECIPMDGRATLLATSDAGKTWVKSDFKNTDPFYSRVHFVDTQTGWLIARDNLYRTTDGGSNWQQTFSIPF